MTKEIKNRTIARRITTLLAIREQVSKHQLHQADANRIARRIATKSQGAQDEGLIWDAMIFPTDLPGLKGYTHAWERAYTKMNTKN